MKHKDEDELSLFGGAEERVRGEGKLDVVRLSFEGAETLTWRELFEGFDSLRAITYSSGIGFACQLIGLFEEVEVIFGCEEVMSFSLQEVMAYQSKSEGGFGGSYRGGDVATLCGARGALARETLSALGEGWTQARGDGFGQPLLRGLRRHPAREHLLRGRRAGL